MPIENLKRIPDLTKVEILEIYRFIEIRSARECWPWTGPLNWAGYAQMNIRGERYRVGRVILKIVTGEDPGELLAIHTCENDPMAIGRSCVNPCHLEAGTHDRNMEFKRGIPRPESSMPGESNPNADLTEAQVIKIIERLNRGEKTYALAVEYKVTQGMISHIKTGRSWSHLKIARSNSGSGGYKLTAEQKAELFKLREVGHSQQKISEMLGGVISQSMVSKILKQGH